uniref:zinc finger protein CONSTANS-LIKE 5-like n=1 Tax=Erigeron canadensis TaxID=72917 RepID=UPI001CB8A690|nr:zinc finger protein CONSTANS-LIKE 5-like [Erigeron canadensis]
MMTVQNSGSTVKGFPLGWPVPAKFCDSCKTAVALLFCIKDTAFLCMACDMKIHSHTRHERVWMCEVCEHAPASVTCKADAAALCVTCDRDIHSANPLSQRHDRVPVVPFYDCVDILAKTSPCTFLEGNANEDMISSVTNDDEIDQWRIPVESVNIDSGTDVKSVEMLFPESDHLLDFDFPVATDSVVPFQPVPPAKKYANENRCEIDFTRSNIIDSYNSKNSYLSQSLSQSVSSSSIDVGIVPEGSCLSEISHPFALQMNGGGEMNGSQQLTPLSGTDREARVMRYREKKKNRKFEKTIRYASRKAYAETRPRIKGRFAKRTEAVDSDADTWLFNGSSKASYGVEVDYGVVPSCF